MNTIREFETVSNESILIINQYLSTSAHTLSTQASPTRSASLSDVDHSEHHDALQNFRARTGQLAPIAIDISEAQNWDLYVLLISPIKKIERLQPRIRKSLVSNLFNLQTLPPQAHSPDTAMHDAIDPTGSDGVTD